MKTTAIKERPSVYLQLSIAHCISVVENIVLRNFLQVLPSFIAPAIASKKKRPDPYSITQTSRWANGIEITQALL